MEEEDKIIDHVTKYYKDLYRSRPVEENMMFIEVIPSSVLESHNQLLISILDEEEIHNVVCYLSSNSASRPDCFGGDFTNLVGV